MFLGSNTHRPQHIQGEHNPGNAKQCSCAQKFSCCEDSSAPWTECVRPIRAELSSVTQHLIKQHGCGLQFRSWMFGLPTQFSSVLHFIQSNDLWQICKFLHILCKLSNECYIIQFCHFLQQTGTKQELYLGQVIYLTHSRKFLKNLASQPKC